MFPNVVMGTEELCSMAQDAISLSYREARWMVFLADFDLEWQESQNITVSTRMFTTVCTMCVIACGVAEENMSLKG